MLHGIYLLIILTSYYIFIDVKQNLTEALRNICRQHGVDGVKKLAYLNAIVKLVSENDVSEYGCSTDELLCW